VSARFAPRECEAEVALLADGGQVRIRPVRPQDKALLVALFDGLGEESRRRRFFVPKQRLRHVELIALTELDPREHEALLALDPATRLPLGVARYIRLPGPGSRAELAIAVADAHQRRGLGGVLVERIVELARRAGVRRLTGVALADNVAVRRLLEHHGGSVVRSQPPAELRVEIPLRPTAGGLARRIARRIGRRRPSSWRNGDAAAHA
jgi:GNAT superfamily N-acetyltransferase